MFVSHDNVITFLKFGITFQIDELVNVCCVWLQEKGLYQELGLLLVNNIEKRLKLLDKLVPRVRQHSAGSAGSSLSSRSGSRDPPSPDPCSPDPDCSPPLSSILSPLQLALNDHPVLNEERWSKAPKLKLGSSSSATCTKVSGDACLVPLMNKMRSDDDKEWKPNSRPLKGKIGFRISHDENREKEGAIPDSLGQSLNSLDSFDKFPVLQKGWEMAPTKKKNKPAPPKLASVVVNPAAQSNPNLSLWTEFSLSDIESLCSSKCVYPEFVKLEVVIGWVTGSKNTISGSWQGLLNQLLIDMDPLQLSDRYLSMIEEHLSKSFGLNLPLNFASNIRNPYDDERPGSGSKFTALQWSVSLPDDLSKIRSQNYLSFFANCELCQKKGKQEVVLRLVNKTPCYDLKTGSFRKDVPRLGMSLPDHYHSNSVFHWFIRVKTSMRFTALVSLITTDFKDIVKLVKTDSKFKVVCLQINK